MPTNPLPHMPQNLHLSQYSPAPNVSQVQSQISTLAETDRKRRHSGVDTVDPSQESISRPSSPRREAVCPFGPQRESQTQTIFPPSMTFSRAYQLRVERPSRGSYTRPSPLVGYITGLQLQLLWLQVLELHVSHLSSSCSAHTIPLHMPSQCALA